MFENRERIPGAMNIKLSEPSSRLPLAIIEENCNPRNGNGIEISRSCEPQSKAKALNLAHVMESPYNDISRIRHDSMTPQSEVKTK